MSKVDKFIQEHTRKCSNLLYRDYIEGFDKSVYIPWLTPDEARKAMEIAREEIYEWLNKNLSTYIDYRCRGVGESVEEFVDDLKQAMKDETQNL